MQIQVGTSRPKSITLVFDWTEEGALWEWLERIIAIEKAQESPAGETRG